MGIKPGRDGLVTLFWACLIHGFGSSTEVLRFFLKNNLKIPRRDKKELIWKSPIIRILTNPAYAGANVYGRTQNQVVDFQTKKKKTIRPSYGSSDYESMTFLFDWDNHWI
jgi:hypothetical protein